MDCCDIKIFRNAKLVVSANCKYFSQNLHTSSGFHQYLSPSSLEGLIAFGLITAQQGCQVVGGKKESLYNPPKDHPPPPLNILKCTLGYILATCISQVLAILGKKELLSLSMLTCKTEHTIQTLIIIMQIQHAQAYLRCPHV